jgi:hypothetical protein
MAFCANGKCCACLESGGMDVKALAKRTAIIRTNGTEATFMLFLLLLLIMFAVLLKVRNWMLYRGQEDMLMLASLLFQNEEKASAERRISQ